jgi:hypothetical protein
MSPSGGGEQHTPKQDTRRWESEETDLRPSMSRSMQTKWRLNRDSIVRDIGKRWTVLSAGHPAANQSNGSYEVNFP